MSEKSNKLSQELKAQIKELFDTEPKLKAIWLNKNGHIFTREKLAINSCETREGVVQVLRSEFFKPAIKVNRETLEDKFDEAVKLNVITRNGSWYKFIDHTLEQNREESIAEIDERGLWDEIESHVKVQKEVRAKSAESKETEETK